MIKQEDLLFRHPSAKDGPAVFELIKSCPPLDQNSRYCNLVQCLHFGQTCMAACEPDSGALVGFVSGYIPPSQRDTLFVWQVAVADSQRGKGVAARLIEALLASESCRGVSYIETTITEENAASWALFRKLARARNAALESAALFEKEKHFARQHDTEFLLRIGPF